jgi:cysteine desulfurase / selenocysteine lyase
MNEDIQQLFPVTKNYIYLNHAAITPYSIPVAEALRNIVSDITNSGSANWNNWLAVMKETREAAARLVSAQPEEIAFVRNTSDGISAVANGINWQVGDNVVSCDIEFPANIYPWMRLSGRGVELRLAHAREGRIEPDTLFELVDERTRVISLSWVQYASGYRANLQAIGQFCRERDILFFVDAIQGLGALRLDVKTDMVDAFAADAHKFLMGPEGLGVLFLSGRVIEKIEPTTVGWMSVKEWWRCFDEDFEYKLDFLPGALRFECGTPNTLGLHALHAALDLMLNLGVDEIEKHLLDLCDYLRSGLAGLGFEQIEPRNRNEASAIVCCRHAKRSPEQLYRDLVEQRIICAPRCGWLRISPHFYNTKSEIDRLLEALDKIVEKS